MLSTFTLLCIQSPELFILQTEILYPVNNSFPLPLSPSNHHSVFCLYEFAFSQYFIEFPGVQCCLFVKSVPFLEAPTQARPLSWRLGVGAQGSALSTSFAPTTWSQGGRHSLVLRFSASLPCFQGLIPIEVRLGMDSAGAFYVIGLVVESPLFLGWLKWCVGPF